MKDINDINDKIIATLHEIIELKDKQIADLKEHIVELRALFDRAIHASNQLINLHGKDKS